ncbi:MAG: hypothetical protein P0Y56_10900 [Candidatus Andeanibacterium colombiense]|uniref:Secreted protein n=1 Tax=Candidatus Andeanibacterium colombiense TaxID=3121345 RepID=A0AAJ5X405_9SPHN|nr:MAG: hypothetical protein P0Y56_10900 [Sphingomonadaceae bacterium]
MKRLALLAFALASGLAAAIPAPAFAQEDPGDSVDLVIVYGNDPCPASPDATRIVVCPRMEENERYRIPPNLRSSDDPANEAWASRVESLETVGASGVNSCSASGYGGFSGCTQQLIKQAYAEKRTGPGVKAAQLIEEERAKRLSTIDADAAAEQQRVEVIEKEYEARKQAEADAAEAAKAAGAQPQGGQ